MAPFNILREKKITRLRLVLQTHTRQKTFHRTRSVMYYYYRFCKCHIYDIILIFCKYITYVISFGHHSDIHYPISGNWHQSYIKMGNFRTRLVSTISFSRGLENFRWCAEKSRLWKPQTSGRDGRDTTTLKSNSSINNRSFIYPFSHTALLIKLISDPFYLTNWTNCFLFYYGATRNVSLNNIQLSINHKNRAQTWTIHDLL